jgi:hypothetical protein
LESLGVAVEKRLEYSGTVPGIAGELRQVFPTSSPTRWMRHDFWTKLIVQVRQAPDWKDMRRKGIKVTIADNGSGMNRKTRASLFQPFFTTGQKGTGLGSIRVKSITGEVHGTCFTVFLPLDTKNPVVPPRI